MAMFLTQNWNHLDIDPPLIAVAGGHYLCRSNWVFVATCAVVLSCVVLG
jgi:hypothetical protein